jgi:pimeloyl-ACP methyl ester carboxylesterase
MLALHGILGSGGNLRTLAKRLAAAAPSWGFALVDLRMHGLSQGLAPPHTTARAAGDLVLLERELPGPLGGVLGHSFGGKVALAFAGQRRDAGAAALEQLWILDASPSARDDRASSSRAIVALLEAMPWPLPSRERFVELVREAGHSRAIADWLAMNVSRVDGGGDAFRMRLDLAAVRSLIEDYFTQDLWSVVERGDAARVVDFVAAGRSNALDAGDRARIEALAPRARLHVLANAGHWLHADDPDGLYELVRAGLASG